MSNKNVLVGTICLFSFSNETDQCEIGYELSTNFQGQGITKEAVEKVIDYSSNTTKVQEIGASLHRDNQSSIKLPQNRLFEYSNKSDDTDPDLVYYQYKKKS